MTGFYAQQVRRDKLPGVKSGGGGVRPAWAPLLSAMLQPLGYRTYHSGKWHLDGQPLQNGFDRSYRMNDHDRFFNPQNHTEDDQKLPAIQPDSGYYTTSAIADHAIAYLRDHATHHSESPFFQYLAFTTPHFPLHAIPEDIERYRDAYLKGWQELRKERSQRQKELGLLETRLSEVEPEVGPPYHFAKALETLGPQEVNRPHPWDQLTPEQQRFQATKMAIHAAMVDRMDQDIGRVVEQLRTMGALDNTLILFLSDNGASAEIMVRGDGHDPSADPGSAGSYPCLGPGFSNAANTPFRRHKTWVHEGGIATPLIVHWPRGITARGEFRHSPGHVIDIVPTLLEIAGGRLRNIHDPILPPAAPGKSLLPAFSADVRIERDPLWWSHEEHRALRSGDWKLVAAKDDPWELYDLAQDRSETTNVAAGHPERVEEMAALWQAREAEFLEMVTE
jgi:arylsulfatase A-like enzyme